MMYCYNCRKEFFIEDELIKAKKIVKYFQSMSMPIGDINNIEYIKKELSKKFFNNIISDISFIDKYEDFAKSLNNDEVICPECENRVHYNILDKIESHLYSELSDLEFKYIEEYFQKKCGKNVTKLFSLPKEYSGTITYYHKMLKEYFPDDYQNFMKMHDFIYRFNPCGGRGGDGEYQIFSIIYNFLTDEFVKNVFYDLLKGSSVFLFTKYCIHLKNKKVIEKAKLKAEQLIEDTETREYYYEGLLFSFLTKKEKKKLINTVSKKMSKEIIKKIKKALM